LGVLGRIDLEDFSPDAAAAARWTMDVLEDESRRYLESLSPQAALEQAEIFHASPRDPVWEYVLTPEIAFLSLEATEKPLILVGHSHIALRFGAEQLALALCEEGTEIDLPRERWLLNPGSVGQPRDGDPRAAWLLVDFAAGQAIYCRVPYAIDETQAEIRGSGLPETLAQRLESGV
jgi:diadenosine tetraphosphatase ApaH/serine/threonine PP2A family protein phosphatase